MSILVKLVGGGIGMAREAHLVRKEGKASEGTSLSPSPTPPPGNYSLPAYDVNHHRELIAEVPTAEAENLIANGQAIPLEPSSIDQHDRDEYDWQLDDAAEEVAREEQNEQVSPGKKKDDFMEAILRLPPPNPYQKLPLPVILPQRRPKDKGRGFVRAYAPVLKDVGIDQDTFLTFIDAFDKSAKSSPILNVIWLSANIVGMVPEPACQITGAVVALAVGTANEVRSRQRNNTFLDTVNEQLFKPRGMYAMVMAFKSDTDTDSAIVSSGQVSIADTIAKYTQPSGSKAKDTMRKLRTHSGKTHGEVELPEAAPLIFPFLDKAISEDGKKNNWRKQFGEFVSDYQDRRAQASFHNKNPESSLQIPKPEFRSRYADPTHPANSGDIGDLLSGGKFNLQHARNSVGRGLVLPGRGRAGRRGPRDYHEGARRGGVISELVVPGINLLMHRPGGNREQGLRDEPIGYEGSREPQWDHGGWAYDASGGRRALDRRVSGGSEGRRSPRGNDDPLDPYLQREGSRGTGRNRREGRAGPLGTIKRVMQKDVLYLMIVNMPSDEEIAEAKARIASGRI